VLITQTNKTTAIAYQRRQRRLLW